MGLLDFVSPGINAAAQVVGGYEQGKEKADREQQANVLLALKQKRQDQQDAIMNALHVAQTHKALENPGTAVTYQQDADGNIVALPTHLPDASAGPTSPAAASIPPSSPSTAEGAPSGPAASPAQAAPVPAGAPSPAPSPPPSPAAKPPTIGTPTGIKGVDPVARAVKIAQAVNKIPAKPTYQDLHPKPDPDLVPVQQADGTVVYTPRPQAAGKQVPITAGGGSLRGLGQGGVFGAGSGIGAVNEMQAASPNLKAFEKGFLADGPQTQSQLNALDRFRQKLAGDLQTHGLITAATASEAERELASTNPDLVVYGRNLKQWIVSDLNLSRSATDKRGALDMEVSGLSIPLSSMPAAQRAQYINQIWEARDARLAGLKTAAATAQVMLDRVTGKKADPTAGMSDADAWEAYRQQGMTPEQATAKVNARKK